MQINIYVLFGIALVALFFGYFFGLFEGRGQGYRKRKAEEAKEEKQDVLENAAPAAPLPAPEPVVVDDPGLLRLKDENGSLRLDLDGRKLDPAGLSPEQRKRLIEVVSQLRPWIESKPAATRVAAPASTSQPAAPRPAPAPAPAPAPRPAAVPPAVPPVTAPVAREEPVAPRTMVGQIDEILQRNIAGTPLSTRGIKLVEAPGGGVLVLVGLQRYTAVTDVPDPEVQAALRTAIQTWERTYTPGI